MAMESLTTNSSSVVSEFEGTLLKNQDSYSYFMLVAYEVSGLIRFTIMLFLDVLGYKNAALKLMIFVATAGFRELEIERVARAVLPKFYMDDDHLGADEVIGMELIVNGFGFVPGLIREVDIDQSVLNRVGNMFDGRRPHLGLARPAKTISTTFLSLCEVIL
ncbi:unnamed protein product [Microthlaspi erraticum]|uniref:Glycerol-3-phosphate acyltransferase RAM2/GPAT1-8 HAD-like domain-containing protein n=1 Tax=Microthlaspi erraticum TaxID=1685480 RepID=A0A6D2KQZ9_9BRAS|nr:unnamed protein product [Microthlaspi erraticum]